MMPGPVVIGAIGGSGTRVVARIVRHAGVFIGRNLNISEDALDFVDFYDRWINLFYTAGTAGLMPLQRDQMEAEFCDCARVHRASLCDPDQAWGWKGPRSIFLVPFIHRLFPCLVFMHLVRDGRDMAFSDNKNQVRKHGDALLGELAADLPEPVRAAALWNKINLAAADYGEQQLGDCYLRVSFEQLCERPEETIARIFAFLDVPDPSRAAAVAAEVTPSTSIGRWRHQEPMLIQQIESVAHEGLKRFGYTDYGGWEACK